MILPESNSLDLPEASGFVVDRGTFPTATTDDLAAMLPGWARAALGCVGFAVLGALRAVYVTASQRAARTLSQLATPSFAEGQWLDEWGAALQRPRASGETDAGYRVRLLGVLDLLTPVAIRGAVERLVREETAVPPVVLEPAVDAMFLAPGDPVDCDWCAFWQVSTSRLWATYPGHTGPRAGTYLVGTEARAEFWVILPGPSGLDSEGLTLAASLEALSFLPAAATTAWDPAEWSYLSAGIDSISTRVLSDVEARRACGVPWYLFIDPLLDGAL